MSGPTFSPDGQWMWNGSEWIPAPPSSNILPGSGIDQSMVASVANQNQLDVNELSETARYFDQNMDGKLQQNELNLAARSMTQQPTNQQTQQIVYTKYTPLYEEKTFYAPLITVGLVALLMFTPFLTFNHDELTNSEEKETCELLYLLFQSGLSEDGNAESDDIDCPMNGYNSAAYGLETISNFDAETIEDDGTDSSSEDDENDTKIMYFGIAMIMLMLSPFIYLGLTFIALGSVIFGKVYPTAIGFLQLIFVVVFFCVSILGIVDITDDFSLSVHGNFTGIGVYLVGLVSVGYFIKK